MAGSIQLSAISSQPSAISFQSISKDSLSVMS